ncbi:MAG: hypothetical protein HP497_05310 [Nitrospira sp.]|nr:hypothetical protein [Nitrospira sp.]
MSAIYGIGISALLLWPTSSPGGEGVDVEAEVKKNLNTPIACGCSVQDYDDLDNRIKLVTMIRSEFGAAKAKYAGSKQTVTPAIRDAVQNPIKTRINNEKNQKATDAGATTYDFGCFTIIDSKATKCLRGALDDHEAVHRKVCDEHPLGFRFDQLVEDWLQEEMDAYDKEEQRLREEKSKQLPFCKLDPSVKRRLEQIAEDKEREKEAQEIADWFLALFN